MVLAWFSFLMALNVGPKVIEDEKTSHELCKSIPFDGVMFKA